MQASETPIRTDDNNPEVVGRLGGGVYETHVRPKLRPEDRGQHAAIDVDSGDFEILRKDYPALEILRGRRPQARILIRRVGELTASERMAGQWERMKFKRFARVMSRGEQIYESHVRQKLKPEDAGRFIAIDVDTGDFEIHDDRDTAARTLRDRRPTANIWATTIRPATSGTPPVKAVDS